ncbi:hypothetical protein CDAR_227311 [Caerostris darwini]|uniref:Uncharacterized protein n=1 Tax=Caerostris darwini TaxID=1538125 RepID=A0AAV4ULU6_9ARAC|nr:hypothetical protein CDAR_227311 [Caerostris darwini]
MSSKHPRTGTTAKTTTVDYPLLTSVTSEVRAITIRFQIRKFLLLPRPTLPYFCDGQLLEDGRDYCKRVAKRNSCPCFPGYDLLFEEIVCVCLVVTNE